MQARWRLGSVFTWRHKQRSICFQAPSASPCSCSPEVPGFLAGHGQELPQLKRLPVAPCHMPSPQTLSQHGTMCQSQPWRECLPKEPSLPLRTFYLTVSPMQGLLMNSDSTDLGCGTHVQNLLSFAILAKSWSQVSLKLRGRGGFTGWEHQGVGIRILPTSACIFSL